MNACKPKPGDIFQPKSCPAHRHVAGRIRFSTGQFESSSTGIYAQ